MNILIVGGTFDNDGGHPSGLVDKITQAIRKINGDEIVSCHNGGYYSNLQYILKRYVKDYEVVFWWPNVPNDLPKLRDVKVVAPYIMLVSSKRNDNDKYSFQELVNHALALKANLTFEFKKQDDGKFNMMVFDPLGSSWYNGVDIENAINETLNRLKFLISITRQKTYQAEEGKGLVMSWYFDRFKENMYQSDKFIEIPEECKFVNKVKEYAEVFQSILKPAKNVTRFLGDASMRPQIPPQIGRCGKGMPSFRKDGYIFVSQRNVDKQFISIENFVPTYLENGKVYYCGDKKPSVDTPIQLRLYEKMPNINYIIHAHCYIKDAPFTTKCVPCGAVEEVDEVCNAIKDFYGTLDMNKYTINLIGHGSILFANKLEDLNNVEYYGRKLPEKMF